MRIGNNTYCMFFEQCTTEIPDETVQSARTTNWEFYAFPTSSLYVTSVSSFTGVCKREQFLKIESMLYITHFLIVKMSILLLPSELQFHICSANKQPMASLKDVHF